MSTAEHERKYVAEFVDMALQYKVADKSKFFTWAQAWNELVLKITSENPDYFNNDDAYGLYFATYTILCNFHGVKNEFKLPSVRDPKCKTCGSSCIFAMHPPPNMYCMSVECKNHEIPQ